MTRRLPRDVRYALSKAVARVWMRRGGKRRIRRLERRTAKADIRKADCDS